MLILAVNKDGLVVCATKYCDFVSFEQPWPKGFGHLNKDELLPAVKTISSDDSTLNAILAHYSPHQIVKKRIEVADKVFRNVDLTGLFACIEYVNDEPSTDNNDVVFRLRISKDEEDDTINGKFVVTFLPATDQVVHCSVFSENRLIAQLYPEFAKQNLK